MKLLFVKWDVLKRRGYWKYTFAMVLYCACLLGPMQVAAQSPVLELPGPVGKDDVSGHIDAYIDEDWSETARSLAVAPVGKFKAIEGKTANFGYTKSKIWLRTRLRNTTDTQTEWRVHFHENFKQVMDVFSIRSDGSVDTLMSLDQQSTFADRPINFPEMVAPLTLQPGEQADLLIGLWSEGSSYITYSFETPESFGELAAKQTAKNFIFYGMMMLLITISLAALVVFRHRLFFFYAAYALSALIYVMHADGVTFQYLWPFAPTFNNFASVMAGTGLIVFGSFYARAFLKTARRHRVMDKVLIALIAVTLTLNLVLLPLNPQMLKKGLVLLSLIGAMTFTLSAIIAAFSHFREVRFYLFAWVGAVISAVLLNLNHLLGIEIGQNFLHDSIRVVAVFDAFMMGLAIADRYFQMRQSRQAMLEQNLQDTQKRLAMSERLAELESQYQIVSNLAETRTEQMQNTIHDLRQPLHALRLSVQNMTRGRLDGAETGQKIDDTFTYLERLVAEQLHVSPALPELSSKTSNDMGLQAVLTSIHAMFLPDATAKGLSFRFVPSNHEVAIDPLIIMRLVTNIVANAIKYTDHGGVLLGARRKGQRVLIEVHDTGSGMSVRDFENAKRRHERLDAEHSQTDGAGLGLSIVAEIAQQHDIDVYLSKLRRKGTGVVVSIPITQNNVTELRKQTRRA